MPDPKKPARAEKYVKRKFFRAFNDKSRFKRGLFSALLVAVPTYVATTALQEDPSTKGGPEATAEVARYQQEIIAMRNALPQKIVQADLKTPLTEKEKEKMQSLKAQAEHMATYVTFNRQLSEYDVSKISYSYRTALGKEIPIDSFNLMAGRGSAYLHDFRNVADKKGLPPTAETAQAIQTSSYSKVLQESSFYGIGVFILMWVGLQTLVNTGLTYGRKRDDENEQEERQEKLEEIGENLRKILTPKNQKPPAP
jgi:hypothetical protein